MFESKSAEFLPNWQEAWSLGVGEPLELSRRSLVNAPLPLGRLFLDLP